MKPVRTYLSLSRARNNMRLGFFLLLLAQVFYLAIGTLKIPIPGKLLEFSSQLLLPDEIEMVIHEPLIVGLSRIELEKLIIKIQDKSVLKLENFALSLTPSWSLFDPLSLLENIHLSSAIILPGNEDLDDFILTDLSLNHNPGEQSLFLKTGIKVGQIKSRLSIEIQDYSTFLKNEWKWSNKEDNRTLIHLTESLNLLKDNIIQSIAPIPPVNTKIRGVINGKGGQLYISQNQYNGKVSKEIQDLLISLVWGPSIDNQELINFKIQANAGQFMISNHSVLFNLVAPYIKGNGVISTKELSLVSGNFYFTYDNILSKGKISGEIPSMSFYFNKNRNLRNAHIFADSNATSISIFTQKKEDVWHAKGVANINPSKCNISAQLPQGELRIINGQKLYIRFLENLAPIRKESPIQFLVHANNFSALQTPAGNFRFTGEIASDFSIHIDDAYGKLGQSEVNGSYYQKWHPAKYRFLVNGICYPPDINNWLGIWWSPIWKDFSFSSNIPSGNFSITGIWGGPPGNSVTIGQVKTQDLKFRDLPLISSNIDVEVDEQSTRLFGKDMKHKNGSIRGNLLFPRSLTNSKSLLSFSFNGDFPVNEAKGIFGEAVNDVLRDLNASTIYCEADGEIYKENQIDPSDLNQSWYELYFSTNNPFSYRGVDLDYAHGKINRSDGLIKGQLDNFGIANGQGILSFSETSAQSDRISISLDLKNAQRSDLFEKLSKSYQKHQATSTQSKDLSLLNTNVKEDTSGKIDLSLQAEGPVSDAKYFEGTGNFSLHNVDIGSIHLLGGIRDKLGAFNLPLPSDALNFNRLDIPFILEHDRIIFDQANLHGPLSKFEANGEINWVTEEVDLIADFKLAGNLGIPLLKQIVNLADPLSKLSKLKIQGNLENPDWSIYLGTSKLKD